MPGSFPLKDWQDFAIGGTPLSAAAARDIESRLSGYVDSEVQAALDAAALKANASDLAALNSSVSANTTAINARQLKTPISKGYFKVRSYSHSIGAVGGGTWNTASASQNNTAGVTNEATDSSAAQDFRNQYSAKLAGMMGLKSLDGRLNIGGSICSGINYSFPTYSSILATLPGGNQSGSNFAIGRPSGEDLIIWHQGANDLGFNFVPLSAFQCTARAVLGRMLSNVTIEDTDGAVQAASGTTTAGQSGTTRTVFDRNSGLSTRQLANGQVLTVNGGLMANTAFPGGEAFVQFIVETGDVNTVSLTVNGVSQTVHLEHVNAGNCQINIKQHLILGGTPTGGTFTLSVFGQTTAAISWNASTATMITNIEAALVALPGGLLAGTGTLINNKKVRVKYNTPLTTDAIFGDYEVHLDPSVLGGLSGTPALNIRMTVASSLTGTSPTIVVKEQAGPVVARVQLQPGTNTMSMTATCLVTAQPVQFDCINIVATGSVPPTIMWPGLHKFAAGANTTWFGPGGGLPGPHTDAAVDAWNAGIVSVVAEFSAYTRLIYVEYDSLNLAGQGLLGDGVHPLEEGLAQIAERIYGMVPILSDKNAAKLSSGTQPRPLQLQMLNGWLPKPRGYFFNAYASSVRQPNDPYEMPSWFVDSENVLWLAGLVAAPAVPADTVMLQLPLLAQPLTFTNRIARYQDTGDTSGGRGICYIDIWPSTKRSSGVGTNAGNVRHRSGCPAGSLIDLQSIGPIRLN